MSRMAELEQLYIHGGYTSATSGRTFETINPANGNVLATVQAAGREDVDRAVKSAQQGQNLGVDDRHGALAYLAFGRHILRERNDELAKLETLDTGKAYSETSTVDIVTGADVLEYYAGLIPALEGSQIPLRETSFRVYPPRTAGRSGRDRRMELPDPDRPVEIRPGAGGRQRNDFQTERNNPRLPR